MLSNFVKLKWRLFQNENIWRHDFRINFWRTKSGLEVDYVLGNGETAIEVKNTNNIDVRDLKGLLAFMDTYSPKRSIVVCNEQEKRIHGKIEIMP